MIDFPALAHFLFLSATGRVPASIRNQFKTLEQDVSAQRNDEVFRAWFATAARRFGHTPISWTATETAELARLGITWPLAHMLDELARIAMLSIVAMRLSESAYLLLLQNCYEHGDVRERCAILRALPFLPHGDGFLPLALEACRSHIQPIFEAIACENPYPIAHFPDRNFNQLVLKALFTETALSRVLGLERRITPELIRMAEGYASERLAASRSIPPDIGRLVKQADYGEPRVLRPDTPGQSF